MAVQHMISTDDNPWNPFENFKEWYAYDIAKGHRSLELLGRLACTSPGLTDEENSHEIESTIDEIATKLFSSNEDGIVHYIKVTKDFSS